MLLINGGEVQSESSASVIFPLAAVFAGMLVNWPHMLNMMRMNAVEMVFLGDSIETNACRWQPYLINNWVTHGRVLTHARTHTHADISCGLCAFMPLIPDNWRPLGDLNKQMDNQAEWSELKWSQSSTGTRSRLHRRAPTSTYFDWPTHTYTHCMWLGHGCTHSNTRAFQRAVAWDCDFNVFAIQVMDCRERGSH